ncbi:MAG: DegV family protein [Lachnospiraceae bacterium]|nr:DegV family protein [Lachnospiraceae bacterium]
MKKIAITTDSNSGISQETAKKMDVFVVPMLFTVDSKEYQEGISISYEDFFRFQEEGRDIKSSQPSPASVIELWGNLLNEYDEIIHIPMSSALSGSYDTAASLSCDFEGRIFVVDNKRISVTQKQSVRDAKKLSAQGMTGVEIKKILEETALDSSIYITVETLKYLKKGGRITPAGAAIGEILNVKPVLQIQGGKIDAYTRIRGHKKSRQAIINAIQKDMLTRFAASAAQKGITLHAAYAGLAEDCESWEQELKEAFPGKDIEMDVLPLNISTHVGRGAIGIALTVNI